MSDNVLDRYVPKSSHVGKLVEENGPPDNLGYFGLLRGLHEHAPMLEFRSKDRCSTAFSYASLTKAKLDPSDGITLEFGAYIVRIIGTNLDVEIRPNVFLFQSILQHRVAWVQQADQRQLNKGAKDRLIIDEIDFS